VAAHLPPPPSGTPTPETRPRADRHALQGGRYRRALERLIPSDNLAGVVFGLIAIGAVLAAESASHESYLDTLVSAAIAAGLYWLVHAYGDVLGRRLMRAEHLSARSLGRTLIHDWAIIVGAAVPLLALVLCWVAGAARETAVTVSLWTVIVTVILLELIAAIRSRATPLELAVEVGVGATMGLAILALKIVLH
jgi:hypothetical protein